MRPPVQERFWAAVDKGGPDECWTWHRTVNKAGYGTISIGGRKGSMFLAHRVSYEWAKGPIPAGAHILHSCDNPPCVNPAHLRVGDHNENMRDMARRERSNTRKLTAPEVSEIRAASAKGETQSDLARRYGVTKGNVAFIVHRKTWKHVA